MRKEPSGARNTPSKIYIVALKAVVTALLLYLFLTRVDFRQIWVLLSRFSAQLIIVVTVLNIAAVLVNVFKWHMLLPEAKYGRLAVACFASYYVALLLPGQLAQEGAKAYHVARRHSVSRAKLAASVLVDKIASIVGLFLVGCVGLVFSRKQLPTSLIYLFIATAIIAVLVLFSLCSSPAYKLAHRFTSRLLRLFPSQQRAVDGLQGVLEAWHVYSRNLSLIVLNILLSAVYQFVGVLMYYLVARELNVSIGIFDWSWIVGGLTLALFLPITIGGLGVREGALIGILRLYGYGRDTAVAISLTAFCFVLTLAILGFVLSLIYKDQAAVPNLNVQA